MGFYSFLLLFGIASLPSDGYDQLLVVGTRGITFVSLEDLSCFRKTRTISTKTFENAVTVVFDPRSRMLYWTEWKAGYIRRAPLHKPDEVCVVMDARNPFGIALDSAAQQIYWTSMVDHNIQKSDMDGGFHKVFFTNEMDHPYWLVFNARDSFLYWTEEKLNKIKRIHINGSSSSVMNFQGCQFEDATSRFISLTLDPTNEHLYWIDYHVGKIYRVNIASRACSEVPYQNQDVHPQVIAVYEHLLFWTSFNGTSVKIFDLKAGEDVGVVNYLKKDTIMALIIISNSSRDNAPAPLQQSIGEAKVFPGKLIEYALPVVCAVLLTGLIGLVLWRKCRRRPSERRMCCLGCHDCTRNARGTAHPSDQTASESQSHYNGIPSDSSTRDRHSPDAFRTGINLSVEALARPTRSISEIYIGAPVNLPHAPQLEPMARPAAYATTNEYTRQRSGNTMTSPWRSSFESLPAISERVATNYQTLATTAS